MSNTEFRTTNIGVARRPMVFRTLIWAVLIAALLDGTSSAQGPPPNPGGPSFKEPDLQSDGANSTPEVGSVPVSWLYASHSVSNSKLALVDEFDGTVETVGEIGLNGIVDIAFLPDGRLFGVRARFLAADLVWINPRTAESEIVGDMGAIGVNALVSNHDGMLFAASSAGEFMLVDVETGAAEIIGPLGSDLGSVGDLAFDDEGVLYATLAVNPDFRFPVPSLLATIDPVTGIATEVGPIGFNDIFGLAFHPGDIVAVDGTVIRGPILLGVSGHPHPANDRELIAIDRQTGVGQSVTLLSTADSVSGLADNFRLSPTPGDLRTISFFAGDAGNQCVDQDGAWTYCQHKAPPAHAPSVDADDTFAWDANLTANADQGKSVYASAPGRVVSRYGEVPPGGGSFNEVLIEHCLTNDPCDCQTTPSDCWWSRYLHMDDIQVSAGQLVTPDSVLGIVSDVGSDEGDRLHFAVYYGENTRQAGQGLLSSVDAVVVALPDLFSDGFESGNASAWSSTVQ